MIEVWGMTEMCRCLGDYEEPRRIDTRAIGRAVDTLEIRVVEARMCVSALTSR